MWSTRAPRPRSSVPIHFMWWPGPLRHWTWSGAGRGTSHGVGPHRAHGTPDRDGPVLNLGARPWKNPEDLTERQTEKLAWIAKTDPRLHRAYLLKEGLRHVFSVKGEEGMEARTDGSAGRGVAVSRCSWNWAQRSNATVAIDAARTRYVQRADRIHQHQDPALDADCIRIPITRRPSSPSHARPWRPPPLAPRTALQTPTNTSVEPEIKLLSSYDSDEVNSFTMRAALIGDVVGSRQTADRTTLHRRLTAALQEVGRRPLTRRHSPSVTNSRAATPPSAQRSRRHCRYG